VKTTVVRLNERELNLGRGWLTIGRLQTAGRAALEAGRHTPALRWDVPCGQPLLCSLSCQTCGAQVRIWRAYGSVDATYTLEVPTGRCCGIVAQAVTA
jgi:hypothetical protein